MAKKTRRHKSRGRLFPKGGSDTARPSDATAPNHPPTPSGPMTRARARTMQQKVNSLLSTLDLGTYLDGMLFTLDTLCVIRYIPQESHPYENQPRHEDEEKRSQRRREEEDLLAERYYRPDNSGTTAPDQPAPEGNAPAQRYYRPDSSGTTADTQGRYYRPSGTTAQTKRYYRCCGICSVEPSLVSSVFELRL